MRRHMTRTALLCCALVACSERPSPLGPTSAVPHFQRAGPPTPVEQPLTLDENVSALCGFPVLVALSGKQKVLELPNRTITTGPGLDITLVNGNTGRTVTLNITGAIRFDPLPNQHTDIVLTGRNLFGDFELGLLLLRGRFDFIVDANGNGVRPLQGNGHVTDVCALIA